MGLTINKLVKAIQDQCKWALENKVDMEIESVTLTDNSFVIFFEQPTGVTREEAKDAAILSASQEVLITVPLLKITGRVEIYKEKSKRAEDMSREEYLAFMYGYKEEVC